MWLSRLPLAVFLPREAISFYEIESKHKKSDHENEKDSNRIMMTILLIIFNIRKQFKYEKHMIETSADVYGLSNESL